MSEDGAKPPRDGREQEDGNRTLEFRPRVRRRAKGESEPAVIGDLLVPTLARLGFKQKAREAQVISAWPPVVGEGVAADTRAVHFARGCLTVETTSPALSHQLHLQRMLIVDGLNRRLGERVVRDIRFRLGDTGGMKLP
jgi:predicted nucleic acid-binding Zn ribbon protein